jgi:HSP20 family protein
MAHKGLELFYTENYVVYRRSPDEGPARFHTTGAVGSEVISLRKEEKMLNMRELIPWTRGREVTSGRRVEHPLVAFQREMDRLFEDFWRGFDLPAFGGPERIAGSVSPRIGISEKDDQIVVSAELPGLDEKDVEVTLTDNVLSIRGEKKLEKEEKERGYTYTERSYGSFERRIPLDVEVLSDKVSATFKNGVLTVTLPKSPEERKHVRHIPVGGAIEGEKKAA